MHNAEQRRARQQNTLFISARAGLIIPATMGEFSTAELHELADGYAEAFIEATSS